MSTVKEERDAKEDSEHKKKKKKLFLELLVAQQLCRTRRREGRRCPPGATCRYIPLSGRPLHAPWLSCSSKGHSAVVSKRPQGIQSEIVIQIGGSI
ncbi:Uncharacterized protein HZ326_14248 [Fusarium oxysporum f. sp. albedinis]|nr:Uncharacterized protein HZ326_14248 [Fusarium oxysporum f. sp. albedinis]